jgi:membrane-associated phospholipid phosphatase
VGAAAVTFSILMGLSRAYLGAHWLSDATAGILLGTSCALLTALIADLLQRQQQDGRRLPGTQHPPAVAPPDHAGRGRT